MTTSSIISKVEKANRYAHELDRLTFEAIELEVRGDNDTHRVKLDAGDWSCGCHFFSVHDSCVHILTVQKVLGGMLPETAQRSLFEVLSAEGAIEATRSATIRPVGG